MDEVLKRYYEDRFSMFSTQGWKDLKEDIQVRIQAIESIRNVKDIDELRLRQGELDALQWVINLEQLSLDAYEELKNADIRV